MVFCLTWAPWFFLAIGGILLLAEPSLILKMLFRLVVYVPGALREYFRYMIEPNVSAVRPAFAGGGSGTSSFVPIPQPAYGPQPDPSLVGHCTVASGDNSAWWLAAGQGGAFSAYVLSQHFRWVER